MKPIRRHLNFANVAAMLALLFAMSGSAVAARHYLLSSKSQISPALLKKLKGRAGPAGPQGHGGAAGATGAQGKEGLPGKEGPGGTLATGRYNTLKSSFSGARNFSTEFTHPSTGIFCFRPTGGLSSVSAPIAMVTVDWIESSGSELSAYADSRNEDCAEGDYEVRTFEPAGKVSDNVSFYIAVPSQ